MNINRNNYEEFFLLYVDNELSAMERNAVDLFVQQNADLGKELQLLQQAIVQHDEIIFDDKNSLRKDGSLALQEKLLLFADDELPREEKSQLFTLLATDSTAAAEWKILQKTKLQPDESIVFEDKALLYRTEGGRVVGFKWWRVAAAAILLGFGIWLGRNVFRSDNKTGGTGPESIAKRNTDQSQQKTNAVNPVRVQPLVKEDSANATVRNNSPQKDQVQNSPGNNNLVRSNENKTAVKDNFVKQNDVKLKDHNSVVKEDVRVKKPTNNLPRPILENVNKPGSNKEDVVIVQPKTQDNVINIQRPAESKTDVAVVKKDKQNNEVNNPDINNNASSNSIAKNAVYNEDESKGDNRILYMEEDKVKRTKIGGIFRRLTRVVQRTTNIKTGNSVKVAGFEIAIK